MRVPSDDHTTPYFGFQAFSASAKPCPTRGEMFAVPCPEWPEGRQIRRRLPISPFVYAEYDASRNPLNRISITGLEVPGNVWVS